MDTNEHKIDRYIVAHVARQKYVVTNGDKSFEVTGKGKAEDLVSELNLKVEEICEAMYNMTGDWSGYAMTVKTHADLKKLVGKQIIVSDTSDDGEFNDAEIDEAEYRRIIKDQLSWDEWKDCKVIFIADVLKHKFNVKNPTGIYWG